ncbi:DnaJsubfamily C member 7 [Sesamum alatum]|uniref:DnaJsubfamily C member 7 n=1 Tax=Sesamum alatum TaxID=300844 RepID=A0AAE1XJG2_9LAMI|nr:DnaJsubfamily C member 7 [Sesamum alatum]
MTPPVTAPHPAFEIPKYDCPSTQNVNFSGSFNFSAGSTDAAGFEYSKFGAGKSNLSSRSRPRLTKIRRKQMVASQDGSSVKTDLGLNGLSDASEIKFDGKLGNLFGGNNENSGSNGSAASRGLNGNMEHLGNGSGFGVGLNDSLSSLGLGNGKSLFGYSMNSSTSNFHSKEGDFWFASNGDSSNLNAQKEAGSFVFGACKAGSTTNSGSNKSGMPMDANFGSGQFVFGVNDSSEFGWNSNFRVKESRGNLWPPKLHEYQKSDNVKFVFGSDKYDSASSVKLDQKDSNLCGLHFHEFEKVNSKNFVFGASKNASAAINTDSHKQGCDENMGKSESGRDAGNTVPDMRGKVKLDTSGDFEKGFHPCFQVPFNWSDSNSQNFVFGSSNSDPKLRVDLANDPTGKIGDMSSFTTSSNVSADIQIQFQNACLNGAFVFGGLKGKGGLDSGGSTNIANDMNRSNKAKAEDCNDCGQDHRDTGSDINTKFQNSSISGGSFQKDRAFGLSDEMRRLNIHGSEVDADKTENLSSNFSVDTKNVFVFGRDQKSSFIKENSPIKMSEKTPDVSHLSHNNSESNRTSSSFFSSVGIGIQLQDGFCAVPSTIKDEKGSIGFTGKLAGLDSSDAGYTTPNVTFAFPNYNLFPGVEKKLDNATIKSLGSKRSKKRNGKLRQRTMVQKLFGQDSPSKEGSSQLNQNSPGSGSPMDFSPYQDTTANAPDADNGTGLKAEFAANENGIPEHCEKSHDDKSNSNFSPLTAQDGLSAVRHQYKKKYKLKSGPNHCVQGNNNSDKENAKLDPKGVATHEVCEHWRIRGNQAYHAGKLSKAEEFYSMGINSFPHVSTVGYSMKPLLLCYSNRAATRMSLGRMREAIGDCTKAADLDPNFLKVALRAGNCYLVLGEVDDAIQCYSKCLSLGSDVCLDRRVTIEAADGVQKAKRVAEYMHQAAKLLEEGTENAANNALANIAEALSVSRYSERLLEMKGRALCILRMYDEVIQLCEQTLDTAKKNFGTDNLDDSSCKSSHVKLWRWQLQTKSHYYMGRLDLALDLIEKQEKLPISSKFGDVTEESSIALAATIRELLSLKKSGNDAFNSGRYTEAIENYTAAISKSFESRPFMAICFCNRAAAYQSISQIVDAIADCSLAIALDENYQKAISRRATLHEMVRDYKQAVYDLQRLISLLESQSQTNAQEYNSQSRSGGGSVRDLRKVRRRLSSIEEKAKKETPLDLYLILGVKASDAESEIKKAYRKAALRHHPDKAGQVLARSDIGDDGALWKEVGEKIHKDADRLFKIIGEAYAVLSDPSKRSKYDSEEEIRNIYRDSNRNSNSGHPSTSYSSPYERGSWSGRQAGFSTPFERNSSRRYWSDARSYSNFHSRW